MPASVKGIQYEFDGKKFNSQIQLSKYVGINPTTFGNYLRENNHDPEKALAAYCKYKHITVEEFMEKLREENKPKPNITEEALSFSNYDKMKISSLSAEDNLVAACTILANEFKVYGDCIYGLESEIGTTKNKLDVIEKQLAVIRLRLKVFEQVHTELLESMKKIK
jgi:hypothetical protein